MAFLRDVRNCKADLSSLPVLPGDSGFDGFLPVSWFINLFSRFSRRHLAEINGSLAAISYVF